MSDPRENDGGCIDVWVWHDGDFPFIGRDNWGNETPPRRLHHCSGDQFIKFGEFLETLE